MSSGQEGLDTQVVRDVSTERRVVSTTIRHAGAKWRLVSDEVMLDEHQTVCRDVVEHPGAVGVLALDDQEQVVLVRQYRHPVRAELWELPAGLLDAAGEEPLDCAKRELYEEAHLRADNWHVLLDLFSSPGMSSERVRIYLARGLRDVAEHERHEQTEEEQGMPSVRLPLGIAVNLVLGGQIHNAMAVAGVLAAEQGRSSGWSTLRDERARWSLGA